MISSGKSVGLSIEELNWQINVWEKWNCFRCFSQANLTEWFNGLVRGAPLKTPMAPSFYPQSPSLHKFKLPQKKFLQHGDK